MKCVKQRGFAAEPFQVSCDENYRMRMLVRPGEMSEIKTKKEVEAEAVLAAILSTHAFRHTHRSWLDAVGTPIAVQQKMMRHTDIRTTMNI